MNTIAQTAGNAAWWLPQQVPHGETLDCRIGPLRLRAQHVHGEWRIAHDYEDEVPGPMSPVALRVVAEAWTHPSIQRYVAPQGGGSLRLRPMLADRPVVIRPRQPVFLPSQTETTLYLSTPVWLRIEAGEREPVLLCEIPTVRLSDTWFGPSTREGELCYSGKTHARHDLAEVPYRSHRALTPLKVRNEASTVLPLEKLSLPVPLLSVYGTADGSLWTQRVSLLRRQNSDMADMAVEPRAPDLPGQVSRLSGPRIEPGHGGIVRAFSVLFGD
jgi:hypothetical protein